MSLIKQIKKFFIIIIIIIFFFLSIQPLKAEGIWDDLLKLQNIKKIVRYVKSIDPKEIIIELILTGISYLGEKTYKKFYENNKN